MPTAPPSARAQVERGPSSAQADRDGQGAGQVRALTVVLHLVDGGLDRRDLENILHVRLAVVTDADGLRLARLDEGLHRAPLRLAHRLAAHATPARWEMNQHQVHVVELQLAHGEAEVARCVRRAQAARNLGSDEEGAARATAGLDRTRHAVLIVVAQSTIDVGVPH
eukprot:1227846-Prymnesium_polylepis.1